MRRGGGDDEVVVRVTRHDLQHLVRLRINEHGDSRNIRDVCIDLVVGALMDLSQAVVAQDPVEFLNDVR